MNKTEKDRLFYNPPQYGKIGDGDVCVDRFVDYPEQGDQTNFARTEKLTREKEEGGE